MAKGKFEKWLEPEGLELLNGWAADGLRDEDIAGKIGISLSTFYEWKKKFPEFSDALKDGKELPDYRVQNALYESALAGNVTAQIFWLKNRRPDKWRDKPEEAKIEEQEIPDDPLTKALKEEAEKMDNADK